jgi:hypothetical protein
MASILNLQCTVKPENILKETLREGNDVFRDAGIDQKFWDVGDWK